MSDSGGGATCPNPFDLTFTISPTTGVISQIGNDALTSGHMTINSNNNFMAGTGTNGSSSQLVIAQKEADDTDYDTADVQSKTIVYHQLRADVNDTWIYGAGTTGATGALTISQTSGTGDGDHAVEEQALSFTLNEVSGIVTSELEGFEGFLSADKKTIVATHGNGSIGYHLMVVQITTRENYPAGTLPAATWNAHGLVVGEGSYAPLWIRYLATVNSSGTVSLSSVQSNQSSISIAMQNSSYSGGTLSGSGEITFSPDDSKFHGQLSDDETFMVATQTPYTEGSDEYHSLTIYTNVR